MLDRRITLVIVYCSFSLPFVSTGDPSTPLRSAQGDGCAVGLLGMAVDSAALCSD